MATKLAPVDVVIVGFGWTGGIIAKELAPTKLKIVALERGGPRDSNPDFIDPQRWDELRYAQRTDLMQDVRCETLTFRSQSSQTPCRRGVSAHSCRAKGWAPPACIGTASHGAGWNGITRPTAARLKRSVRKSSPRADQLPRARTLLREVREDLRHVGQSRELNGRMINGGNLFEGRASASIRIRLSRPATR